MLTIFGDTKGGARQQREYGRAKAMLERRWPDRYRGVHAHWAGRIYSRGPLGLGRSRVYYGTWGSELFQSLYSPPAGALCSLLGAPEWHLWIAALVLISIAVFSPEWWSRRSSERSAIACVIGPVSSRNGPSKVSPVWGLAKRSRRSGIGVGHARVGRGTASKETASARKTRRLIRVLSLIDTGHAITRSSRG